MTEEEMRKKARESYVLGAVTAVLRQSGMKFFEAHALDGRLVFSLSAETPRYEITIVELPKEAAE